MKMRIGAKLMVGSALSVLVAVSAVSFAAYRIARDSLERQIFFQLESVAESRAAHIETFLAGHKETTGIAATSYVLASGLRSLQAGDADRTSVVQELSARMQVFLASDEHIYDVFLLDRHGEVVASTAPEMVGLDRSTDAYFVGAREAPFIKDAFHSAITGRDSLAISAPILDGDGDGLLGVLVARLDMAGLNAITTDHTGLGETGETYLINKYGFMITPARFKEDTFLKQKVDSENARQCLADIEAMRRGTLAQEHEHKAVQFTDYHGVRVLGVHNHIPEMGWGLLAEIDASEAFAPIAWMRSTILTVGALLAAVTLVLSYLFARRITRPIHELHTGSERIGSGELGYRLDIKTGDEIEQLADEFNRMAAKLSESYASLERKVEERTGELTRANESLEAEVAERKRAEEALRASESKYRTLLENIPQNVFSKDTNLVYLSCNEAFARELGITTEEFGGKTDFDFFPRELAEKYRADDRRIMESGQTEDIEEAYIKDGEEIVVHTVKTPLKGAKGDTIGTLGIFWDVTDRKRAEEEIKRYGQQLERLNTELKRSNRDLQEFTYTVSHDLKEPLRKIHAFGQFLVEDCGENIPEEGRQHLHRIQDAAVRMKVLIEHLLSLARVGTQGKEIVPVDPRPIIDETLGVLSEKVRECGAEVTVEDGVPPVMADAVQLGQLFQNLISNALKFRSPERVPRVLISSRADGSEATFSVADNGIGIEARFREKIFGIFQRLHTKEQYEGVGVGLALCEKIVRRHGGRIWVDSEFGEGSTFHFTLSTASAAKGRDHEQ